MERLSDVPELKERGMTLALSENYRMAGPGLSAFTRQVFYDGSNGHDKVGRRRSLPFDACAVPHNALARHPMTVIIITRIHLYRSSWIPPRSQTQGTGAACLTTQGSPSHSLESACQRVAVE